MQRFHQEQDKQLNKPVTLIGPCIFIKQWVVISVLTLILNDDWWVTRQCQLMVDKDTSHSPITIRERMNRLKLCVKMSNFIHARQAKNPD